MFRFKDCGRVRFCHKFASTIILIVSVSQFKTTSPRTATIKEERGDAIKQQRDKV